VSPIAVHSPSHNNCQLQQLKIKGCTQCFRYR